MPTTIHPSPEDGGTPALGEAAASSHPYAGVAMPGSAPPEPPEAVVRFNYPDSHSFVFMAHPDWFDVFKTGPSTYEVLPSLRTVRRKPGSCGVKYVKGHDDGDATLPILDLERAGWRKIPANTPVTAFGVEVGCYYHVYKGRRGPIFLEVWTRLQQVGEDCFPVRDDAGYHVFQRRVRDWLPAPRLTALLAKRESLRRLAAKGEMRNASPAAQHAMSQIAPKVDALDRLIAQRKAAGADDLPTFPPNDVEEVASDA